VKPAPFDYLRATSVDDVIDQLRGDDGAKVIAGGQSLVPLMAMRLARPTVLVDVNDLPLDTVAVDADGVRIGATTRHRRLERDPVLRGAAPLLAEAAGLIGHPAIRVRGTIGGSLAHADPLAELPAVLVAAGGSVVVRGPGGDRTIAAADLFEGFLTTTIAPDELLLEVRLPLAGPGHGDAFCEWAPRAGDFATAGIAVLIERDADRVCVSARAAAIGVASVPVDCSESLAVVVGASVADNALLRDVARRVRADLGGDDDRCELAGLLAARAVLRAFTRSAGAAEVAA
jgi:aerobic carbon-monoxide dehydrogenase medium subunit